MTQDEIMKLFVQLHNKPRCIETRIMETGHIPEESTIHLFIMFTTFQRGKCGNIPNVTTCVQPWIRCEHQLVTFDSLYIEIKPQLFGLFMNSRFATCGQNRQSVNKNIGHWCRFLWEMSTTFWRNSYHKGWYWHQLTLNKYCEWNCFF